jgi:phosphoadenosine phosphosulfate reductase
MRPETVPADRAARLTADLNGLEGAALLARALAHPALGRTAVVSSFGADSVVLLHLLAQVAPATPVLFLDTQMLFPETLDYQRDVAARLGLTGVRVIRARALELARRDPANVLHRQDTDACCDLRKTRPLEEALAPFDSWITGRKRFQTGARAALPLVEEAGPRLKLNPLAGWGTAEIAAYMDRHALPRHPLVARGYPSIGCAPCTGRVQPGEDPRAGRWRGSQKEECGIHFIDGRAVRGTAGTAGAA